MVRVVFRKPEDPGIAMGAALEVDVRAISRAAIDLRWGCVYIAFFGLAMYLGGDGAFLLEILPVFAVVASTVFLLSVPMASFEVWRSIPRGFVGEAPSKEAVHDAVRRIRRRVAAAGDVALAADVAAGLLSAVGMLWLLGKDLSREGAVFMVAAYLLVWSLVVPFVRFVVMMCAHWSLWDPLVLLAKELLCIAVLLGVESAEACLRRALADSTEA